MAGATVTGPARPVTAISGPDATAGSAGRAEATSPEPGAEPTVSAVPAAPAVPTVSAGGSGAPVGEATAPDAGERAGSEGVAGEWTGAEGDSYERAGAERAEAEGVGADGAGAEGVGAERIRPLHDPDPYSTPPYGEPGPWAPAPPVQHPAVTPAHGTAIRTPPAPPTPTMATPAPALQDTPAPVQPSPRPQSPAPAMAPAPHIPGPATAPVPAQAPAPQAAVPATAPSSPVAQGAPPPQTPVPVTAPAPQAAAPATAPPPPVPPTPQDLGPWSRYDPWAAGVGRGQGALQQTGGKVLTRAQRRRRAWRWVVGWSLVVAVVSGGIGGVVGAHVERERLDGVRLPQAGSGPAGRAPDSVAGIAARALPGVVTLHVRGAGEAGTGTGFVLDAQGHILTNNHVVEPAGPDGEISVTFSGGDTVRAEVVGRDGGYDLAVVQVHGVHGLTPLSLGDSDDVRVGDPVVAIGAPFGLADTVTSGIISAKQRPVTAGGEKSDGSDLSYVDALQTDAPINPGNSGGPLLDSRARVIGVNSAIRSAGGGSGADGDQAGSIGLGFAIPVNQAKRVAEELIDHGHATHPVIGVTLDMGYTGDGARVGGEGASGGPAVAPGGPGDRAGLKAGDVITGADGERVHTGRELIVRIRAHRPGDRLRLTVEHGGTEREVSLVLGASEQN
ncbi:trypsin-like peptidase domain-containing protein [Streptomyces nogalater]|uniref:Trypsin-like peptidase domain-containing protein n=1 Tax=Streptomyces nogalater TaxID=38314 RepID=A0ABW0WMA8_STRNO